MCISSEPKCASLNWVVRKPVGRFSNDGFNVKQDTQRQTFLVLQSEHFAFLSAFFTMHLRIRPSSYYRTDTGM